MAIREVHWEKTNDTYVETTEDIDVAIRNEQRIVFKGKYGEIGSAAAELFYNDSTGKLSFHNPNGETVALPESSSGNATGYTTVRAGSTGNVTISSLIPTASLDDVVLVEYDYVILKNQTNAAENGIYCVKATGGERCASYSTYNSLPGLLVVIQEGTANADSVYLCTSNKGGEIDVDDIVFTQQVVSGELLKANNLSDLNNFSTARENLGVEIGVDVQAHSTILDNTTASYTSTEQAKLAGIEALADVTDTTNVTAAGALMDSELTSLSGVKTLTVPDNTTISAFGATLVDDADAATARTTLGLGSAAVVATDLADLNETTIETAIDTLPNLTSIGSFTGVLRADSGTLSVDSDVTDIVAAATTSAAGKIEIATTAEIDTGTDSTRAMPVDQFVASKRNIRWLVFNLVEATTDCATGTNLCGDFLSPVAGTILQSDTSPFYIYATNSTAGTTGTMTIDVEINGSSIMTTNKITIDSNEKTSTTAATMPDLTTTSLAVGDIITINVGAVHTTAAKGLTVYMAIRE